MNNRSIVTYIVFIVGFLLLSACNNNSKEKTEKSSRDAEILREYNNHYENDTLLVRVDVIQTGPLDSNAKEVWLYSYDDNDKQLRTEKKYKIKKDGTQELYYHEIIEKNKKTYIYLEGKDTTNFVQWLFDDKGNIIQDINRTTFPEDLYSNNYIQIDTKKNIKYDNSNRILKVVSNDNINKTTTVTTFSYETKQDTLIKQIYEDGKLLGFIKTISPDKSNEIILSYNADNEIESKEEIITANDGKSTIIKIYFELESVAGLPNIVIDLDTTIFFNGKEIKNINQIDNQRIITIKEYDKQGNITKERETIL